MRRLFYRIFLFLILSVFCLTNNVLAQDKTKPPFPTQNTVIDAKPDPKKQHKDAKPVKYIIKNDTKNTLSGNQCFEEVTRGMGFQYLAVPKGQAPNKNGWSRWRHNFGVKCVISWKNGPFWKVKVNKRYKECKYGSGDYTG